MSPQDRIISVLLLICSTKVAAGYKATDEDIRQDIDTFVNAVIQCNNIPGANVAVVRGGEVFHKNGYGVKNLVTQEPFTSDTLVNIASVTKQFVSTTMAKVFELNPGYDWDSTVRSILGDSFYLSDGYMSNTVMVKDLLCHRVGLARHDLLRSSGIDLDEMVSRLRHLTSSQGFRDSHQYNNLMYNTADKVIRVISGANTWEDIVQTYFLDPLQMNDTTFVQRRERWEDFATAYFDDGGQPREVSLETNKADYDLSSGAGGVGISAADIAKWMLFQLSEGKSADGTQLVDIDLLRDTHTHCGVSGGRSTYTYPDDPVSYNRASKALGWFDGFYRSYELTGHSGSKGGFESLLTLFPDVDIGIFATVTGPNSRERDFIHLYIADLLLNETAWLDPATVCDELKTSKMAGSGDTLADIQTDNVEELAAQPFRDLSSYEGTFGHFGYGNLTIAINSSTSDLDMTYGASVWSLTQNSNTTFSARGNGVFWFRRHTIVFEDDGNDNYNELTVNFESTQHPRFIKNLNMDQAPPPPQLC